MKNLKNIFLHAVCVLITSVQVATAQDMITVKSTEEELSCGKDSTTCQPKLDCEFELALLYEDKKACIDSTGYRKVTVKHHYKSPERSINVSSTGSCSAGLDRDRFTSETASGTITYVLCGGKSCELTQLNFPSEETGDGIESDQFYPYHSNPFTITYIDENGTVLSHLTEVIPPVIPRDFQGFDPNNRGWVSQGALLDEDCEGALSIRVQNHGNGRTIYYDFENVTDVDVDIKLLAQCGCANDENEEDISLKAKLSRRKKTKQGTTESFEEGMGDWEQSSTDNTDWLRNTGGTPSNQTGPSNAFHDDYFIYIEASGSGYPSKTADLVNPSVDLSGIVDPEIRFQRHMYGSNMGTLRLQARFAGTQQWTDLWSQAGDQGDSWEEVIVSLSAFEDSVIDLRFQAITGNGYRSDMAIDYIEIAPPRGANPSNCVAAINSFPYVEDFNNNTMGLLSKDSISTNWNIINLNQLTTAFPLTIDGTYLYMRRPNWDSQSAYKAGFTSPCFDLSMLNAPELFFSYYMAHADDSLILNYSVDGGQTWSLLSTITAAQGNVWNEQYVDLSNIAGGSNVMFSMVGHSGVGTVALAVDNFEIRDHYATDCTSMGTVSSLLWIDQIHLGLFNYYSGDNGGYGDYTSSSAALTDSMLLRIEPGFAPVQDPSMGLFCSVWVDYNQDGDFDDQDELVLQAEQHPFLRGDANADGNVDIADMIYINNVLFNGMGPFPCYDAADANDDGIVNITDAIYLANYLFAGTGPAPPEPYPTAGLDPTDNSIQAMINIPPAAFSGSTKMRIQAKGGNWTSGACETFTWGEVEDYTVDVVNLGQARLAGGDNNPNESDHDGEQNLKPSTDLEAGFERELLITTYPNPSDGIVNLSLEGSVSGFSYELHNLVGQLVLQQMNISGESTRIDLSELPKGIYTLTVHSGTQRATDKVIVQ